ncbi:Bifunctional monodehydroascorbate reductase and carbonic anhydrase nectarin-3 [Acorus calamus]|uniref:Carbonic anhydrase n=1 Tax=Acorus calamus TaxID=4465 RepID=A0AAV9ECV9_ACOCL|nr:Bifunctional monodehydroascorbate reductase and carbonic anhydrase nectarin-3 [Acorus calamus]
MASRAATATAAVIRSFNAEFISFGYTGAIGPYHWGSLSPDYYACSTGKLQSPINIIKDNAIWNPKLEPLTRYYNSANGTLVDSGFNIQLRYDDSVGGLIIEGKNYTLKQMHWHTPSEHTIDGIRYPVELHLVHMSKDGDIAVVAILYNLGHPDPFLDQLKNPFKELTKEVCSGDEEAHVPVGLVETKSIKRNTRKYFRYMGSLTTPPCTENVTWSILGKVRELSMDQLVELRAPLELDYKNNSRPTQPLNGRHVYLFDEKYPNNLFGSGASSNNNNSGDDNDDNDDRSVP